jgi:hypothetical protein
MKVQPIDLTIPEPSKQNASNAATEEASSSKP